MCCCCRKPSTTYDAAGDEDLRRLYFAFARLDAEAARLYHESRTRNSCSPSTARKEAYRHGKALYRCDRPCLPAVGATVLRQSCASVFVRSVDGAIRLEGAEVSKPVPGRPPENSGIHCTGDGRAGARRWMMGCQLHDTPHGHRAMLFFALDENDLPLDVSCAAVEQADNGSYVLFPLGQ